ncbi:MAG: MarR family transcriptional regulator [Patescibacteria group bacterium]|jgi:DNA-binding MarR family transcriptional regulator
MKKTIPFLFSLVKTNTILSRRLSVHGLAFTDFMILSYLDEAPEQKLRRVDLAEKLGLTASGITRMLLPLEKLGIIERNLDDNDARARYATITKAGKNLLEDAKGSIEMKLEDIIPEDEKDKLIEFTKLLEKINS